jgi:hypothetical protein
MDSAVMRIVFLAFSLTVTGILAYGGVTIIALLRKRLRSPSASAIAADAIDAIHARLEAAEALEHRVAELEERLDFAERVLANHAPEQLPAGPRTDSR